MKIKEFEIKKYRSIDSLKIKIINNLLQIIGENNSGKTNILLALKLFFSKSLIGLSKNDFFMEDLENEIKILVSFNNLTPSEKSFFKDYIIDDILKIERIFNINEETMRSSSSYNLCQKVPNIKIFDDDIFSNWSENKPEIEEWITENEYEPYFYNEKGNLTKNSLRDGIPKFIDEKQEEIEDWKEKFCEKPFNWKEVQKRLPEILYIEATKKVTEETTVSLKSKSIYNKIIEKIILNKIQNTEQMLIDFQKGINDIGKKINKSDEEDNRFQIIKKIEDLLLKNLNKNINTKELEIKFFTPTLRDFFSNSKIFINDGIHSSIDEKGDGLKRSLIFALFITYSNFLRKTIEDNNDTEYRPFVFLIEEPELYLHPQAQKELMNILSEISKYDQVLYSTHSPYFVNIENYLSLVLVKKTDIHEGTKKDVIEQELFEPESKKEFNMLMRFNPERNEMFFAKKIVLVEGDVEQIVINGISDLLDKNLNVLNISVIECGGKTNLLYFVKILSQFDKPILLIHDIDPLSEEEQKDIEDLRDEGCSPKKIEKIKFRKRNFKLNKEIKTEIEKYPEKMALITIDPNFETLIGISPKKSSKPYKAFNFLKSLELEDVDDNLKDIITLIIDFKTIANRSNLEEKNIVYD